ncbi:hypothetical protein TNCV_2726501 [Trichonephila clavipes]|nr:hypothetical protein TNCV_2726501 [Trichonephila clavipes]
MWSMSAQRLTPITPPAATPDQLWQRVEAAWSTVPQEYIQGLFESIPRCMATVAAIRDISRSCLDPNDFTVLNCIVKGHASLSLPSLRLRLCSRITILAT